MFKAKIKSKKLKETIESVSGIVNVAIINLDPYGISVKAVDPANVAMITLNLKSAAFEEFTATEGKLAVDLSRLKYILGMAEQSEIVELGLDEESHKLVIGMGGLTYKILLLNPDAIRDEPKVPQLKLPASIVMAGNDLKRAVKAAEKVSDHMGMGIEGDIFYFEAEGDSDRMRLDMTNDQLITFNPGDANSLFSLDYLSDMVKAAGKAAEVTIELGRNFPAIIKFQIADGNGEVSYLLAPRIESD